MSKERLSRRGFLRFVSLGAVGAGIYLLAQNLRRCATIGETEELVEKTQTVVAGTEERMKETDQLSKKTEELMQQTKASGRELDKQIEQTQKLTDETEALMRKMQGEFIPKTPEEWQMYIFTWCKRLAEVMDFESRVDLLQFCQFSDVIPDRERNWLFLDPLRLAFGEEAERRFFQLPYRKRDNFLAFEQSNLHRRGDKILNGSRILVE